MNDFNKKGLGTGSAKINSTQAINGQSNLFDDPSNTYEEKDSGNCIALQETKIHTLTFHTTPKVGTKAYKLLVALLDFTAHKRGELDLELSFNGNLSRHIQTLRGDPYHFNILSVEVEGEHCTRIQLDPRHRDDPKRDATARLERYKAFKGLSCKHARHGAKRLPKAIKELSEAEKAENRYMQAANDEDGGQI